MQTNSSFKVYNASAGSGKTFTLVKEYLKILLLSNNSYKFQQILAVTFTNKAADEMKVRVIENLNAFSKEKDTKMLQIICDELNLTPSVIFKRSERILNAIFQNYAAFGITTIDSFTHRLIRTFAYDLRLSLNFDVEMDAESLLNEAVDNVISKIGEQKQLTDLLIEYAIQKLDDDKSWDISEDLKTFSKIILNENDAFQLKSLENLSIEDFKSLKEKLLQENKNIEKQFITIGQSGLDLINSIGVDFKDFYYSQLPKHFTSLVENSKKAQFFDQNTLKRNVDDQVFYSKSKSANIKDAIESILSEMLTLYAKSEDFYRQKTLNDLVLNSIIPLAVLNYINKALQEIKVDSNVMLNAEFNQIISDTIKNEPSPFIYERLGEKYRYYFIDEMQDTSLLQWQNLIPLIGNAITSENELGEIGKLLLVGDAKQSIYRWRGGKAEQFIELSSTENQINNNPFFIEKELSNLETNFRSYSEIIDFNNSFFSHISSYLSNSSYKKLYFEGNNQKFNENIGGYVQLNFLDKSVDAEEKDLKFPQKILETINSLDANFSKSDVCVLVRTKKQGILVANFLSENGIEIISSETLLISNSEKVQFLIDLLNSIQNPTNRECKVKMLYYLYELLSIEETKHAFIDRFLSKSHFSFYKDFQDFGIFFNVEEFIQLPFYESVEYSLRSFQLLNESDSNLQFFLDVVFEYQQKKDVSLSGFLDYWDLKKDKLSIVAPEARNAVRIMTIHKSKGLEFPVVIFPYDLNIYNQIKPKAWIPFNNEVGLNSVLVDLSKKLNYIGADCEAIFNRNKEELELDNFNILYVALTRASEQLYIITEKNISANNEENVSYSSGLFINFLKEKGQWNSDLNDYSFGSSVRIQIDTKEVEETLFQEHFISNPWRNHNISIVTNSSLLWDTEQGDSILYGNLIHEILSKINTINDIDEVVSEYVFKGFISNTQKKRILNLLNQLVNHPELSKYYSHNNKVFCEREIISQNKQIIIPDRLVVNDDCVTIIDYKTGKPNQKYHYQLNNYATILEEMNFKVEKKLLVYINEEISIEEV